MILKASKAISEAVLFGLYFGIFNDIISLTFRMIRAATAITLIRDLAALSTLGLLGGGSSACISYAERFHLLVRFA